MPRTIEELPPCRRKVCGHPAAFHDHWNGIEYCGTCGRSYCADYLGPSLLSRLRGWLRAR